MSYLNCLWTSWVLDSLTHRPINIILFIGLWPYSSYSLISSKLKKRSTAVKHVLLEFDNYNTTKQRYFNAPTLKELFDTVNARDILGFTAAIYSHKLIFILLFLRYFYLRCSFETYCKKINSILVFRTALYSLHFADVTSSHTHSGRVTDFSTTMSRSLVVREII